MTAKQQLFVEEYLLDLNATQAAIRAGYPKKSARAVGHENLTKPDIAAAVSREFARRSERTEITQDKVLAQLALIGFAEMPKEEEVRVSDKLAALDKLRKHFGMFTAYHHHSGEIITPVREMSDEELLERASQFANRLGVHMGSSANGDAVGPSPNGDS